MVTNAASKNQVWPLRIVYGLGVIMKLFIKAQDGDAVPECTWILY
jgi:hypothetical protein